MAAQAQPGEVGGTFALTGNSITLEDHADILATSGGVTLTATGVNLRAGPDNPSPGDIRLGQDTRIDASGYVSTIFDAVQVVGGGSVQLLANQGSIDADPTARIDVSSPDGLPGYAGQVSLIAPNAQKGLISKDAQGKDIVTFVASGNILSNGSPFDMSVISGNVAGDSGGRLIIDAQSLGSTALAPLPAMLDASVDLHLRRGDVQIASAMRAASVSVTADGGTLTVTSTIDTSGAKGGPISLFGQNGVTLAPGAQLLATASDATKRGGEIVIGTEEAGVLKLDGGLIDVSNTANAANGGTVRLRAPLTGAGFDDVAINPVATAIRGASSVTVEGFRVFDTDNSAFNGVIDPAAQPDFYGSCDTHGVCSGTLIDFVQKFALSAVAQAKFSAIPSTVLHLQPGIELVNNDPAINNGDITVARAWNLGSGVAGFLVAGGNQPRKEQQVPVGTVITDANGNLLPQYAFYTGDLLFVPGTSQITSLNYRVGGAVTGEAGTLTLRAARDVNINASITDGFFNTRNQFDATYQKNLNSWIAAVYTPGGSTTDVSDVGGYLIAGATFAASAAGRPMPLAPYDAQANGISPAFSAQQDKTPISGADLFPLIQDPNGSIQDASGARL